MKRFLVIGVLIISLGVMAFRYLAKFQKYQPTSVQPVQAMGWTPVATDTPAPTLTPLPTVDYKATDNAFQLAQQAERDRMIEIQLQHDADMLDKQIELARIGATQTFAPTAVALESGRLTAVSIQATSTAEAPVHAAQLLQVATNAKHEKRDNIIFIAGAIAIIIFLLSVPAAVWKMVKIQEQAALLAQEAALPQRDIEAPEGMTSYEADKWVVPCNPEQMTEIWEMVVNGERNFGINRIETTSRTLRRPTLIKMRRWFRVNEFAIELPGAEIALNDAAIAFIEGWGENHELEPGYSFVAPPLND